VEASSAMIYFDFSAASIS